MEDIEIILADVDFELNRKIPHNYFFVGDLISIKIDSKGRAIVPSQLRKFLPKSKNGKKEKQIVYFVASETNEDLTLGKFIHPNLYAEISEERLLLGDRDFFRNTYRLELDKQGRVQLPDYLINERFVLLVPEGDRLTMKSIRKGS